MLKQIILQTSPIPSMQDQIHEMIQRKKPIYIFGGLGDMSLGSINAKYLENQGIMIDGFIANQAFIKTSTYMDKPVFAIEDYSIPRDVSIIIGISKWKIAYQELQKFNFF